MEDPECCRNPGVEQAHLVLMQEREQILRFLIRDDEFNLYRQRPLGLEQPALVQHVVAAEAGRRPERRAATDAALIGFLQEPFPHQASVVTVILVDVEPEERPLHELDPLLLALAPSHDRCATGF